MELATAQPNVSDVSMKEHGEGHSLSIPPPRPAQKLLCMTPKRWYACHFLTNLLLIILLIASLASPKWIKTGSDDMSLEGGLLTCTDCDPPFNDMSYKEAADADACDLTLPDYTGYCLMFNDLKSAGGAFLFFDLISVVFLLFWTLKLFFLYRGSVVLQNPRWLFYVVSTISCTSHILALIIWGGVTSAAFNADCSGWEPNGTRPDLCSTAGPAIAITVLIILLLNVILFWVVQWKFSGSGLQEHRNFAPAEMQQPGHEIGQAVDLEIPSNL